MQEDTHKYTYYQLEKISVFRQECDICKRSLLHPPIRIPDTRAVPLKHQPGAYSVPKETSACRSCALEVLKDNGEFETDVLDGEFEPDLAWVVKQEGNRHVLSLQQIRLETE